MSNLITHDITLRAEAPLRSWTYLGRFGKGLFSQGIATLAKSRKLRAVFTPRPENKVKVIMTNKFFPCQYVIQLIPKTAIPILLFCSRVPGDKLCRKLFRFQ